MQCIRRGMKIGGVAQQFAQFEQSLGQDGIARRQCFIEAGLGFEDQRWLVGGGEVEAAIVVVVEQSDGSIR